ncbi:MAG: hypothetical protein RMK18_06350 [Armatimonadota bacterium]|nr:hypothetical protein [Armatimonadota bacterium]MDW8025467.1 hypothetical protein [Armatimonadota bacterium]
MWGWLQRRLCYLFSLSFRRAIVRHRISGIRRAIPCSKKLILLGYLCHRLQPTV